MIKETVNKNGSGMIDYLQRPHRVGLEATLKRRFPGSKTIEILNFLEESGFMVVKRVPRVF